MEVNSTQFVFVDMKNTYGLLSGNWKVNQNFVG